METSDLLTIGLAVATGGLSWQLAIAKIALKQFIKYLDEDEKPNEEIIKTASEKGLQKVQQSLAKIKRKKNGN